MDRTSVPLRVRPKAARLLGLDVDSHEHRVSQASDDAPAHAVLLTPVSLRSEDSWTDTSSSAMQERGSPWVADWPEPEEYEADPLRVWQARAHLPKLAGVPHGATNEWMRRHAWQWPLDPLFVVKWTASLVMGTGYALLVYPLATPLLGAVGPVCGALVVVAMGASVVTSSIDPQAREAQGAQRDLFYQQQWGTPVVDSVHMCRVCCVRVQKETRHCKRCNKCVARMDHHCRWLNTCIGARNYVWFFTSLCLAVVALSAVLAVSLYIVYVSAKEQARFVALVTTDIAVNGRMPAAAVTVLCVLAVYTVAATVSLVMVVMLLALHVRLCVQGTTTIEYDARRERENGLRSPEFIPMRPVGLRGRSSTGVEPGLLQKSVAAVRLFVARTVHKDSAYEPISMV
ncbi:hypothetical protein EV180_004761 [Coemansia sp. RSA 518]|nr:hypothetical protein IW145_003951 [Coemansia sp. RSA 521]KAJ2221145.1 hypothetical protein EV180_004761 [Coemansia sp. RSA 518]